MGGCRSGWVCSAFSSPLGPGHVRDPQQLDPQTYGSHSGWFVHFPTPPGCQAVLQEGQGGCSQILDAVRSWGLKS